MNAGDQRYHGQQVPKSLGLHDYIDIFRRRKWWVIVSFVVGTLITILFSLSLPPIYRSSTLILVEPQHIPTTYVTPTVTSGIEERLNTLRQQIMSRTNLEKIIREFNLQAEFAAAQREALVNRLKTKVKEILAGFELYDLRDVSALNPRAIPEEYVNQMRSNIEVEVLGRRGRRGNDAFTVSYSGRNPLTVMRVTNTLASFFIEENLRARERVVKGTTEFLDEQLAVAAKELETQERILKDFKERHMGALPIQMNATFKKLDRLQTELQTITEALANAEEKRISWQKHLMDQQLTGATLGAAAVPLESRPDPREVELQSLKDNLARLRAQFKEHYPDIALLKKQINELEAELAGVRHASEASEPPQDGPSAQPQDVQAQRVQVQVEAQLQEVQKEISALNARKERIHSLINVHEKLIEDTFGNEQKLADLTRNYEISQENYQNLLQKRLNARLAENLEKRQQGEQFRIVDPAHLPTKPYKPNHGKIIFIGSIFSAGVGLGLAFLLESLNPSSGFRKPEDVQETFDLPLLVTIPRNKLTQKDHHLVAAEDAESIVTEQYRILYTKIDSMRKAKSQQIFAVTSAIPHEGKTVTALNLAVVSARDFGKKTLLLEGDFKQPAVSLYLKTELQSGLVDILLDTTNGHASFLPFADTLIPFADDNLSILPAAKSVWNSSGLLSSQRMKNLLGHMRDQFEVIVIDAPPVLPLSDMNIFQDVVDAIILVVRAESTPKEEVTKAIDVLGTEKLIGFVLNDIRQPLSRFYRRSYKKS